MTGSTQKSGGEQECSPRCVQPRLLSNRQVEVKRAIVTGALKVLAPLPLCLSVADFARQIAARYT